MVRPRLISKIIAIAAAVFVFLGIWSAAFLFAVTRPSLEIVQRWDQDPAISYGGARYMLAVYEDGWAWGGFPLHFPPTHSIYVGRQTSRLEHGHRVRFSFDYGIDGSDAAIRAAKVRWTEEGVWLEAESGHSVFVPRAMFVGGR